MGFAWDLGFSMINIDQIKQLREETGVSISECKKALQEAKGDFEKAKEILRKWGKDIAGKRSLKNTGAGLIESYIHPNKKVGVMLDIRCETDFVGKTEDFQKLAHEICLQIAAMNPLFLKEEDIPPEFLDGERKIYQEQLKDSGKPQNVIEEIVEGKLKKYKEEISLMSQLWVKDEAKTIKELIDSHIARIGENIIIKKFSRFEL